LHKNENRYKILIAVIFIAEEDEEDVLQKCRLPIYRRSSLGSLSMSILGSMGLIKIKSQLDNTTLVGQLDVKICLK